MTEDQKRKCLVWIAARRDAALALGLVATARSWQEMYFQIGSRRAGQMVLGRKISDFFDTSTDAGTTP
jgi:hypothetical protein